MFSRVLSERIMGTNPNGMQSDASGMQALSLSDSNAVIDQFLRSSTIKISMSRLGLRAAVVPINIYSNASPTR